MYCYTILFLLLSRLAIAQPTYLIEGVQLFDGFKARQNINVLIKGTVVDYVEDVRNLDTTGLSVISGAGKTIVPGLVNCHVHAWLPYHLKNAMDAGVFALLDMHTSAQPDSLKHYQLEDGFARFYSAGYAATVQGGHGTQYGFAVPTIGQERSPEQFVQESLDRGSDYIKIIYEPQRNTLTVEQVQKIVVESRKQGMISVAHISKQEHARSLAGTGLNGFAHLWKDAPADQSLLDSIAHRNMFIVPTLSVMEGIIAYYAANRIQVPLSNLEVLKSEVKRLSENGILLLAGTDPPNVGLDYGSSLHNELMLYVSAGLSPLEALKTATLNPNQLFGLGEIGIIKEGMVANFNLIDGNPLERIEDISKIEAIWAGGKKIK